MQTEHNLEVIDEAVMPPEVDQWIRELLCICFPPDVEKTYDRSFKAFAKTWGL